MSHNIKYVVHDHKNFLRLTYNLPSERRFMLIKRVFAYVKRVFLGVTVQKRCQNTM